MQSMKMQTEQYMCCYFSALFINLFLL